MRLRRRASLAVVRRKVIHNVVIFTHHRVVILVSTSSNFYKHLPVKFLSFNIYLQGKREKFLRGDFKRLV